MRVALYARVSTSRQAQAQTIEQQLTRLRTFVANNGWTLSNHHIYRDDGYSGAKFNRPGLDDLRDQASHAAVDAVVITAVLAIVCNRLSQLLVYPVRRTF